MTLAEIKAALRITDVLDHYQIKYSRKGAVCCPFHDDRNPSMQVFFDSDMVRCFSGNCAHQGRNMDVIDFCMYMEKTDKAGGFRKATELAQIKLGLPVSLKGPVPKDYIMAEEPILERMWSYFRQGMSTTLVGREYAESRGLDYHNQCVGYNSGQFHQSGRQDKAFIDTCVEVGLLTPFGTNNRTGQQAYSVFGRGSLVFPLRDKAGKVTGLYFRNTHPKKRPLPGKHYYLKNRQGLFPHYPKPTTKKIILTESIIDAVTLLQQEAVTKEYEVLALYGTNGWSDDHTAAFEGRAVKF